MIQLDHVTLTFPDGDARITAVDEVSLTAHPGTVTAITGPSGSGKSSLLAVAATLIRPDSGRVIIGDVDTTTLSPTEASALRRRSVGIVFQQPNLLPSLTAREQLMVMNELGGADSKRNRARIAHRADERLAAVGLGDHRNKRPLGVDEPTSALEQARGAEVIELILGLTEQLGTSTLLVTHDLVHLPRMHEVVRIVDGKRADPAS